MKALDFATRKLKTPRLLQPEKPLLRGGFRLDQSHPQMRGLRHWWDGLFVNTGEEVKISTLPAIVGNVDLPRYNRDALVRWDNSEQAVLFQDKADTDYFRTASLPFIGGGAATMSCWFKVHTAFQTASSLDLSPFGWGYDGTDNCMLEVVENSSAGRVEFWFKVDASGTETKGGVYFTDTSHLEGRWVHWAGVFQGANAVRMYLNGVELTLDSSTTNLSTAPTGAKYWMLGRSFPGTGGFTGWRGWVRDARVYERALSGADVAAMYRDPYAMVKSPISHLSPIQVIHPDMVIESGNYLIGSSGVDLLAQLIMSLDAGSYSQTGNDIGLTRQFLLELANGSYTITPSDIGLNHGAHLGVTSGVYNITGGPLTFTYIEQSVPGLLVLTVAPGNNTLTVRDIANTLA